MDPRGSSASEHYTVELEPDEQQWWPARCVCGADLGVFPTAEDAADALMGHAFEAGRKAANSHSQADERGSDTG